MNRFGPKELLDCYARGVFPMADGRDDPKIFLLDPDERGIIPLDGLHISKSLQKTLRKHPYRISYNEAFLEVVEACAEAEPGRLETWINDPIIALYTELHALEHAHSIEVWDNREHGDMLVGGLYGVSLGGAFFGESMFSRADNTSKIALTHLVKHLNDRGFTLLDTQFITDHLKRMGAVEISRAQYQKRLKAALNIEAKF